MARRVEINTKVKLHIKKEKGIQIKLALLSNFEVIRLKLEDSCIENESVAFAV